MIERIRQWQTDLQFGLAAQHLLALPFLSIGWLMGFIWQQVIRFCLNLWVIRFCLSSFIEGWLYWGRK